MIADIEPSKELRASGLPRRVLRVLTRRYITTLDELADHSVYELLQSKCSPKTVAEVCAFLERVGRPFSDMDNAAANVPEFREALMDVHAAPSFWGTAPGPKPFRLFSDEELGRLALALGVALCQPPFNQKGEPRDGLGRLRNLLEDEVAARLAHAVTDEDE